MLLNLLSTEWMSYLWSALGGIFTLLLIWGTLKLNQLINSKVENETAARFLTDIACIVSTVVGATMQTTVDNLKGTTEWTKETQDKILNDALETCLKTLSTETKEWIVKTHGDITLYLTNKIEAEVRAQK